MLHELNIVVISDDGWNWVIAWAQLGVRSVKCLPLTTGSREALSLVIQVLKGTVDVSVLSHDDASGLRGKNDVVWCTHVGDGDRTELLCELARRVNSGRFLVTSHESCCSALRDRLPSGTQSQSIRHRRLGGLTAARVTTYWGGTGCGAATDVKPGQRRNPLRPLDRFLEPSVKLTEWRRAGVKREDKVWSPRQKDSPGYPWPLPNPALWVEAPTVYFANQPYIERPLTVKEKAQLLDVREDWGNSLAEEVWTWFDGGSPPIRLIAEFVLAAYTWLTGNGNGLEGIPTNQEKKLSGDFNWSRTCPPGLSPASSDADATPGERRLYFGWVFDERTAQDIGVATKPDDAEVDLSMWNVGGDGEGMAKARTNLRAYFHRRWVRMQTRDAARWFASQKYSSPAQKEKDRLALQDCIERCTQSTWWDCDGGSRLFFWRWGDLWRREARDGVVLNHKAYPPPRTKFADLPSKEDWVKVKDREKLTLLIQKRYLEVGPVILVVPRFCVPKGLLDIRVVWDFKRNGFNVGLYTPWFFLFRPSGYVRRIEAGTYAADIDIKEQFHNYLLHENERKYAGVVIPDELLAGGSECIQGFDTAKLMRWTRLPFGIQSSPYLALRQHTRLLERVVRAPSDLTSAFSWTFVKLNLPGMKYYDPALPRVRRVRLDGRMAAALVSFFDDVRPYGPDRELAAAATRQVATGIQHHGGQDAARKRTLESQRPRAWAGSIAHSDLGMVRKFISQKKWDRLGSDLVWFSVHLAEEIPMPRKTYRSKLGFILHTLDTYEDGQPYAQGFFLSLYSHLPDRDAHGYREDPAPDEEELFNDDLSAEDELDLIWSEETLEGEPTHQLLKEPPEDTDEPEFVEPVPRLARDVASLRRLFHGPVPLQVIARPAKGARCVCYGGGDASGEGFGSLMSPLSMPPLFRTGFWCSEISEKSSNYREFKNLLEMVRTEAELGRLAGFDIWIATDNSTAEASFHKGRSSSEELDEMVLELRETAILGNFALHLFHVAGTRMIELGIDGASRGEIQLGALIPGHQAGAVPLHLGAIERSESLLEWLQSWCGEDARAASPSDWFWEAQQAGQYDYPPTTTTWIWAPAPAAALDAIEELGNARLKRHDILKGIFIVPHLLRTEWFRRFRRIVDCYFTIPAGTFPFWPANMHEPLTVGIYLPLLRFRPWDWRQVPFLVRFAYSMQAMCKKGDPLVGDYLREFWTACDWIATMPERMVFDVLQHESYRRFLDIHRSRQRR